MTDKIILHQGNCLDVLRQLAHDGVQVDAVITDPPYHLTSIVKRFGKPGSAVAKSGKTGAYARASKGFMGKQWDGGDIAFQAETWALVQEVMKPGAYLAAFSATRTYHRMAAAIEDAGFEIRDSIYRHYGSGFPKSHNVIKSLIASNNACVCHKTKLSHHYATEQNLHNLQQALDSKKPLSGNAQQNVRAGVRSQENITIADGAAVASQNCGDGELCGLREAKGDSTGLVEAGQNAYLQQAMQRRDTRARVGKARSQRAACKDTGKLRQGSDEGCEKSCLEGRGNDEAPTRKLQGRPICESAGMGVADGAEGPLHNGASTSHGADVRLPNDANGSGEPHRPQPKQQSSEQSGTVANECGPQAWGGWPVCDGCGKPIIPEGLGTALKPSTEPICLARKPLSEKSVAANVLKHGTGAMNIDAARVEWQSEADAATAAVGFSTSRANGNINQSNSIGKESRTGENFYFPNKLTGRWPANIVHDGSDEVLAAFPEDEDSGSVARFFYTAKADAEERFGSNHPTVKPLDLMRWMVRLLVPKGGLVLDLFAGTGTTGIAAFAEGSRAILIEREDEYCADIRRRIDFVTGAGADSLSQKMKNKKERGEIPLFAGVA